MRRRWQKRWFIVVPCALLSACSGVLGMDELAGPAIDDAASADATDGDATSDGSATPDSATSPDDGNTEDAVVAPDGSASDVFDGSESADVAEDAAVDSAETTADTGAGDTLDAPLDTRSDSGPDSDGADVGDGDSDGSVVAPAPSVTSTAPADGSIAVVSSTIAVSFSTPMNPTSLTAQTAAGTCTGSIQLSLDDFATCVAMASGVPTMSGSNGIATWAPKPGVLLNRAHKIRVTTGARSAMGIAMTAPFAQGTGFVATSPPATGGSVVISQVYGGGGNSGAPYTNDFVELHNRSDSAVNVGGWSVQYGSVTGTAGWSAVSLTGSIPAGGFYLVQFGGATVGSALPTADASTALFNMSALAGKLALVNATTALSGACPTSATIVDLVGWGSANCAEATTANGPASGNNASAVVRAGGGCTDSDNNAIDFAVAVPAPRNSASPALMCPSTARAQNESGSASEADMCQLKPASLNVPAGSSITVSAQLYEAGLTPLSGAPPNVVAQLGIGPANANPEYEAGWTWYPASYNTACTTCGASNDEFTLTLSAPAAGTYRYVYRVSLDNGSTWTLCDVDGAGSNAGLTFDLAGEGPMTTY